MQQSLGDERLSHSKVKTWDNSFITKFKNCVGYITEFCFHRSSEFFDCIKYVSEFVYVICLCSQFFYHYYLIVFLPQIKQESICRQWKSGLNNNTSVCICNFHDPSTILKCVCFRFYITRMGHSLKRCEGELLPEVHENSCLPFCTPNQTHAQMMIVFSRVNAHHISNSSVQLFILVYCSKYLVSYYISPFQFNIALSTFWMMLSKWD